MSEQTGTVAARHRHANARRDQARPHIFARIDGIAHPHVGKTRIAHAAHRGNAAGKLLLGVLAQRAMQIPAPDGVADHLVDKVARRARTGGLAATAQVNMQVDQARHKVRALKVNLLRACRPNRRAGRAHRADATRLVNGNGHIRLRLHIARAVKQRSVRENVGHGFPFSPSRRMRAAHDGECTVQRAYQ